jgi:hypothetical protein
MRLIGALTRFWRTDQGLSVFLVLLLVVIFVLPPVAFPGAGPSLLADVAFAMLLVAGVRALSDRGAARLLLLAAATVAVTMNLGSHIVPISELGVRLSGLLSLALLLVVVLARTFRGGAVTFHRIQGAVAAYLVLGVLWAEAYGLVALLRPGAFSGSVDLGQGRHGWLYFSFVTLTTVGYGDIAPVHPAARSLAILEAVTGPLYLAVLLARLVALAVTPHAPGDGEV